METVSHRGKVVQVTPESTTVEIISSSACSACHASGICGMSEYTKKAVEVPTRAWENFTPGEEVNVVLKASMGHKAVWRAYVLPLLVLVAVLMVDDRLVLILCILTASIVLVKNLPAIRRIPRKQEMRLSLEEDISYKFDEKF